MLNRENVIEALEQVEDPELSMNVWFLGLIYDLKIENDTVRITMTFTTPFCPYGPNLVEEIREKVMEAGAKEVTIEVVFEPQWQPNEDVRLALGMV
jgi:metal-sulfur cluster biosynthetic enzyme